MNNAADIALINQPPSEKSGEKLGALQIVSQLYDLASPYWRSEERVFAWGLLFGVLALNMGGIYCAVLLNEWNARFYNALQTLDKDNFSFLLFQFLGIVMIYITILVAESFMQAYLAFKWRIWLTKQILGDWLSNNTFCKLFTHKSKTENPDQRISQDVSLFTSSTLTLSLSIVTQLVKSVTFAFILWTLSSSLLLPLPGGIELKIPGYMLWITIIYVIISTVIIYVTGKPLVKLDYAQEKVEADFRFGLMRIRERRDEVSMIDGANAEKKFLHGTLQDVISNYKKIIKRNIYVNSFQYISINFTTILPILAAAPMFFSGVITLGILMQIANAFSQVEGALMVFAMNFQAFASWKATFNRILDFKSEMSSLKKNSELPDLAFNLTLTPGVKRLHIENLTIHLPESQNLTNFDFSVNAGEKVLLMGRSGLGKSTLLKCIAGNWPYALGAIERPEQLTIVPQKPYFPISTLRNCLLYPNLDQDISDNELYRILEICELNVLKGRLDEVTDWLSVLSLGEQQRLNFARIILARPDWLIMDEPTASMDKGLEARLFTTLFKELPNITLLTIGHATSLKDLHSRCIEI